jgi:hypothetical protein
LQKFLARDTRITILEGPFTAEKVGVTALPSSNQMVSGKGFYYQATLKSGKWIKVRREHVPPGRGSKRKVIETHLLGNLRV